MLTPEQIVLLVETLYPTIDELNVWITKDLIKRLMARLGRNGELFLTATDDWQLQVFQAAGGHLEALQKELARWTKKTDDEIRRVFEAAGVKALAYDSGFYMEHGLDSLNLGQSEGMIRLLEDAYRRTVGTVHNFTRSTVETSQQRFMKVLDDAHFKVASGAESYSKAVQEAVQELATEQTTVRYPSGHTDTIETAVLRAVRTGVGQASGNMAVLGMEERDWDVILVSAHLGARYGDGGENPGNHFWWQGKFYTRTGRTPDLPPFVETTGYGTGEGLCGWNCRHSFGPGDLRHNPYKQYDAEENKKAYDLSQKQRRKESAIRRTKQEMLGYQAAIQEAKDPETKAELQQQYDKTALTLKRQNEDYNQFCKDNDLKRQGERLQLARWDQAEARKSIRAAEKEEKVLALAEESDTMNMSLEDFQQSDADVVIPEEYKNDYSDYEPLNLSPVERSVLSDLRLLANQSETEYGCAIINGAPSERFTSHFFDKVAIPSEYLNAENVQLLHSHTNASPLSKTDLKYLTRQNVRAVGVITNDNEVFIVERGEGDLVSEEEYWDAANAINSSVDVEIMEHPRFNEWTPEQRTYCVAREQLFQIARRFGWRAKGGRI